MNFSKAILLAALCLFLPRTVFGENDLTVHSGGTLVLHTNVQVNGGSFILESGAALNMDLGSSISATNIVYGGTLTVSSNNLVLAGGQNYQLFSASTYSGAFLSVDLPALTTNLTWSNALSSSGSVLVRSIPSNPQFSTLTYSSSGVVMSGSGGTPNGNFWLLTTTDLNLPKTNWTVAVTGTFDNNGSFAITNAFSSGVPQQFFLLQVP